MPRANIAAVNAWRAEFQAQKQSEAKATERRIQQWSALVLILTVLYLFIGPQPYQHGVELDAATGGAQLSPINRYAWMLLGGMAAPLLYFRREQVVPALKTFWILITLYVWFFMTTLWALDPTTANRRLFLYIINLEIALALGLGFGDTRKAHFALSLACVVMIVIDALSALSPKLSMTDLGLAGIHGQKNQLGLVMMVCGMVVGPYCLSPPDRRYRLVWIGAFLGAVGLLVLSQSKTSLAILFGALALAPVLMVVLSLRPRVIQAIWMTLVATLVAGLLGWLAWCALQGLDPMAPIAGITFTQRTDVWAFVFSEIVKRPWTGSGFGSFWDINPILQPSLNHDLWFGSPDLANQAHNGYLDLLVTTGVFGLAGALFILFRWMGRGLALIRRQLLSPVAGDRGALFTVLVFGFFPTLIFVHNFMESSYFTANSVLGPLLLIIGADLDLSTAKRKKSLEGRALEGAGAGSGARAGGLGVSNGRR
jgi:O-antigen ligase